MQNRRSFLKRALAAPAAAAPLAARSHAPGAPPGGRRRRIIWNNDGDDLRFMAFGLGRLWTADNPEAIKLPERYSSAAQFLDLRMTPLAGTQVDSLFYCGHFNWSVWDFPRERIAALGPDPLTPVVDFAHKNGMEFFFSIRMNDCHSSFGSQGPAWWEPFRLANPQLLQANVTREEFERRFLAWAKGDSTEHPLADVLKRRSRDSRDYQSWSAYDYAHPEVRAYFLSVVAEACRRYDLEGIELDWLRHPFFFRFGQERRYIPVMRDFVRQVRSTLDEHGKRRGRPILLAARVPDSPESALAIGLDPETWMADGCVDLLIAGNGNAPFSAAFSEWVRIGHAHKVPVYGSLDRMEKVLGRPEAVRAAAYRAWQEGVDGIYFFNHFIPAEYGTLREVGEPARLERMNKLYRIDPDYSRKQNFTIAPGQLPLHFSFAAGPAAARLKLDIADRPETAARTALLTHWSGKPEAFRISWKVNGQSPDEPDKVAHESGNSGWLAYPTKALTKGLNRFQVIIEPRERAATPALTLEQVRVSIDYS